MSRPARFWGSALGAAAAVAALATLVPLYPALRLTTADERERAWLLTVWTVGVLGILFGLASRLSTGRSLGVREVAEAQSLPEAVEQDRRAGRATSEGRFDLWAVATGLILVGIYFLGWLALGRD